MNFDFERCQKLIGYNFKDKSLLIKAFTHSSYTNEHKDFPSNERLEFLGDSILGYAVTERLFKQYPDEDEGDLTVKKQALVSKKPLAKAIMEKGLDNFLIVGDGEKRDQNKINIAENLFEAIVAAIYLDGGIDAAKKFIFNLLDVFSVKDIKRNAENTIDYKSRLLHFVQAEKLGDIKYYEISASGPDHKPTFVMAVKIGNKTIAKASGSSHKEAEKFAAKEALKILQSEGI